LEFVEEHVMRKRAIVASKSTSDVAKIQEYHERLQAAMGQFMVSIVGFVLHSFNLSYPRMPAKDSFSTVTVIMSQARLTSTLILSKLQIFSNPQMLSMYRRGKSKLTAPNVTV
jgi:hypothetical protein